MKKIPGPRKYVPISFVEHSGRRAFVYAIQCGEFVKVGMAINVKKRLAALQAENPHELRVIITRSVPYWARLEFESLAHAAMAEYHHRGEWFRADAEEAKAGVLAAYEEMRRRCGRYETRWRSLAQNLTQSILEEPKNVAITI